MSSSREGIKFFDPSKSNSRRIKFDHVRKWRGDHRHCGGHRSGECASLQAWKIMDKTWGIVPDIAIVSVEEGAMATVKEEGKKGAYPEPVWRAKGWLEVEEAEGVSPTEEVKRSIIERLVSMKKVEMEHRDADYETVEKECARLRNAAESANGLGKPKGKGE